MSNIPRARTILEEAKRKTSERETKFLITAALRLMTRVKSVQRIGSRPQTISAEMRRQIFRLHKEGKKTEHEIANAVGLRNAGRVSDVLHGRR